FLARGDAASSAHALDAVAELARAGDARRRWEIARARTALRAGDSADAVRLAESASKGQRDATAAHALAVYGVALAFLGDENAGAQAALEKGVEIAREVKDARIEAVALVSLAIGHQRGGRAKEARVAYEEALAAAEKAGDAWTLASARLNLAGLAKT